MASHHERDKAEAQHARGGVVMHGKRERVGR